MQEEEKVTEVSEIWNGYRTFRDFCSCFYNKKRDDLRLFLFVRITNLVHLKLNAVHLNG